MLPLSQSHLTLLDTCARKYQHVFFDALSGPSTYEQHTKAQWGSQFHRLMQQQALNLPVSVLSAADVEMANSLAALEKAAPDVFAYLPESQTLIETAADSDAEKPFSQSEHRRTLSFNGYLLTVVYDLVVMSSIGADLNTVKSAEKGNGKGQIFDWKTYQQPQKKTWLEKDWQTRLYPYVLCETSALSPENVSMTYWFVRLDEGSAEDALEPSSYTFQYSMAAHERTRKDLLALTDTLTRMRQQAFFSMVAIAQGLCDRCPFNVRCDRAESLPTGAQALSKTDSSYLNSDPARLLKAAQQLTVDTVQELPL